YHVVVTMNGQEVKSETVSLSMSNPPVPATIDVQPQSQTAVVGDAVVFSVEASGDGDITYQWYFEDGLIENATEASYTIAEATLENSGAYHVVVTMNGQEVISETVVLNVEIELSIFQNIGNSANYVVYPNPVISGGKVQFSETIYQVTVYDPKGIIVNKANTMIFLDTSNFSPGVYIIHSNKGIHRIVIH
ncbi:MAG: immunoglobulin domain-containing protein, partial [Cytophagaceae bacterium]